MFRFLADENLNGDIVRGLLLRDPKIDIRRVQDTGLGAAEDPVVLAWAAEHNRILLTHDRNTCVEFAHQRVIESKPMPGVFVIADRLPVRSAIDELILIVECSEAEDWNGLVEFLPL